MAKKKKRKGWTQSRQQRLNHEKAIQLIKEKDLSIVELKERSGLSKPTLRAIVNGRQKYVWMDTIQKLAKALNVRVAELMMTDADTEE